MLDYLLSTTGFPLGTSLIQVEGLVIRRGRREVGSRGGILGVRDGESRVVAIRVLLRRREVSSGAILGGCRKRRMVGWHTVHWRNAGDRGRAHGLGDRWQTVLAAIG